MKNSRSLKRHEKLKNSKKKNKLTIMGTKGIKGKRILSRKYLIFICNTLLSFQFHVDCAYQHVK